MLSFSLRWVRRQLRFRSLVPTAGMFAAERSRPFRRLLKPPRSHPPSTLKGVRILDVPYADRAIGVLSEHRRRRLTAVLACRVIAFSLLDPEAQERRLARWGLVLVGRRRRSDPADPMDRADRAGPGRRARPLAA